MSKNFASYETLLQKNPLFQGIPQVELPCVLEKLKAHTRYYKKEETIRALYQWDESSLIHIIIIITTDNREVHHTIRQQFTI